MPACDRHEFRVEAAPCSDVLLRIIGPFAVEGAILADVRHVHTDDAAWTVLEVTGLDYQRAELLRLRLAQVPSIREVRLRACLAVLAAAK